MGNFEKFLGIKVPDEETTDPEKILKSAISFAEYLTTDLWPQFEVVEEIEDADTTFGLLSLLRRIKRTETKTRLYYYLCGSLATMLLARATSFTEMDGTQLPDLVPVRTIEIPKSARKILASFARPIGDVDYVPINYLGVETTRSRKVIPGPFLDEVPEAGRTVFRKDKSRVMFDPVGVYGIIGVVKVTLEGRDYYIASPIAMFGYKAVSLLKNYEKEPEKFNFDFGKLLSALREMYDEEELIQTTKQIFAHYEKEEERWYIRVTRPLRSPNENKKNPRPYQNIIPKYIEKLLNNQKLPREIRTMFESLRE
jgi:hypothetical protein